jgi:hypothetical protein
VFERVVKLRNQAAANHGTAESQAKDENALLTGVKSLFAVAENYPQLKADANFRALQEELAVTEDRIAAARRFFNGNVREMRNLRESFPTSVVGTAMGIELPTFFELDDANEARGPARGPRRHAVAPTATELLFAAEIDALAAAHFEAAELDLAVLAAPGQRVLARRQPQLAVGLQRHASRCTSTSLRSS